MRGRTVPDAGSRALGTAGSRDRTLVADVHAQVLDPAVLDLVRVAELYLELHVLVLRPPGHEQEHHDLLALLADRDELALHVVVRPVGVGEPGLEALGALVTAADREAVHELEHAVGRVPAL